MSKYIIKELKKFKGLFFVIFCLFTVAVCVILTLSETHGNLSTAVENFYIDNSKDDYIVYNKNITEDSIRKLEDLENIKSIEAKLEADFDTTINQGEKRTLRIQTIPKEINQLYYYDKVDEDGITVSKRFLDANNLKIGDTIKIGLNGKNQDVKIVASVISPELLFSIKSWYEPSPDGKYFSDAYITYERFKDFYPVSGFYNKLTVQFIGKDQIDNDKFKQDVENIIGKSKFMSLEDQISDITVNEEIGDLETVSVFFTGIFAIAIISMLIVISEKIIDSNRKKIAIFKSIGVSNIKIDSYFIAPFVVSIITAIIAGTGLSLVFIKLLLSIYTKVFNIPYYDISVSIKSIIMICSLAIGILITIFLYQFYLVRNMSVARVLKGENKSNSFKSSKILTPLNFGIKYPLRSILRNKSRSAFTCLAIVLSFILLITSFFFYDSLDYSLSSRVNEVNNYSYKVTFDKVSNKDAVKALIGDYNYLPEMQTPAEVQNDKENLDTALIGISSTKDKIKLLGEDKNPIEINSNSCVIPHRYKQKLGYDVGDMIKLKIKKYNGDMIEKEFKVTDVAYEYTMFAIYISEEKLLEVDPEFKYTGAYIQSNDEEIYSKLINIDGISTVEAKDYIFDSYATIIEGVSGFANIIFIFSVIVLASIFMGVSYININSRKREFAIMKLISAGSGYIYKKIAIEMNIILVASLAIGGLISNPLKGELSNMFSNNRIEFLPYIATKTYLIIVLVIVLVINLMLLLFIKQIKQINFKKELFK